MQKSNIKNIARKFRSILKKKKMENVFLKEVEPLDKEKFDGKELVVSLTSIPSRLSNVHLVIDSILKQKKKPNRIVLYMDEDMNKKEIPENLKKLVGFGLEFEFVEDIGPHTKYYYAFQDFPNSLIVTIDDDVYYDDELLEDLINSYNHYPNSVSARRAHKIVFDDSGYPIRYNEWEWEYQELHITPRFDLLATGVGGVLYDPELFNKILFDKSLIIPNVLKQDDVWLKAVENLSKIPVVLSNRAYLPFQIISGTQEFALMEKNVGDSANDIWIRNVILAFKKAGISPNIFQPMFLNQSDRN